MSDLANFLEKERTKNRNLANEHLAAVNKLMAETGADTIEIEFDGCGDSGDISGYAAFDKGRKQIQITENDEPIYELGYHVLELSRPGWEINAGSFGTIEVHSTGAITLKFNERYESSEYSEDEVEL